MGSRVRLLVALAAVLSLRTLAPVRAATDPSLNWKTISTEHFDVHYHEGTEWTARQIAAIAEEIHPYITGLYQYDPGRVNFIVKDTEDYANGATYYYDNKIEIWATNLEFGFRGTTQWLRNVVTHEYTHMVSIQAAMKMPRRIPALYFQLIDFEDEKRPDVLYGYPDIIASYPYAGAAVPPWFAEGTAQYQSPSKQTDCWDTHRDMILRSAVLEDKMLSYDDMGFFGHGSMGNEEIYDHGYGLVRYIAMTYGPEAIEKITAELGGFTRLSIDGALKKVTGKGDRELYADWQDYLRARYAGQAAGVNSNPREGRVLSDHGYLSIYPSFSPDGARVAFLSNKGSDYSRTDLYLVDRDGRNLRKIKDGVSSRPVFSPDGKKLLYARHRKASIYNAMLSDLHEYDFDTKKEKRLTTKLRASEPAYSPDGKNIACILNTDGTHRLAVMGADGSNVRAVFEPEKGTQLYLPQYSADGTQVLFGIFEGGTRNIAVIDANGSGFHYLVKTGNDERDARWLPDGSGIVFASDRTGIFNVYMLTLADQRYQQLTNLIGGAFAPDVSRTDGALVYSGYDGDGYHISVIDEAHGIPIATLDEAAYAERAMGDMDECVALKREEQKRVAGGAAPAVGKELEEPKDYDWTYSNFQFFPRVVVWDNTVRLGVFIAGNEILDKQLFFLGGSYGLDGRFDAFINYELRPFFPVLYMEFIRMREITSDTQELEGDPDYVALNLEEVQYDLWAADLGVRLEFEDPLGLTSRHDLAFWYSHGEYRVHIDWTATDYEGEVHTQDPVAWRYFVGNDLFARYRLKAIQSATDADINPRGGREVSLQYMRGTDQLFNSGEFEYGFRPEYTDYRFSQYTVDWREYLALPWARHTLQLHAHGSFIDKKVDDFFWVYLGGMDGIRGYSYYSIGGRKGAIAGATYRFPIWRRIGKQWSWLTLRDIYGGAFFEAANAWKNHFDAEEIRKSAGLELRLQLGSYYTYPTAVNFVAARSLDRSVVVLPAFDNLEIVNEPQWRYYLSLGFTF